MKKKKTKKDFIQKAYFKGGTEAMRAFVKKNLKYPKEAMENKVEGVVPLKIKINYLGKVIQVKVVSGLGFGCDEEAIRLAKLLEFEVETNYRKRVYFQKKINIHFNLPKKKEQSNQKLQIKYELTSSKEEIKTEDQQKTYSYVLPLKQQKR